LSKRVIIYTRAPVSLDFRFKISNRLFVCFFSFLSLWRNQWFFTSLPVYVNELTFYVLLGWLQQIRSLLKKPTKPFRESLVKCMIFIKPRSCSFVDFLSCQSENNILYPEWFSFYQRPSFYLLFSEGF
jgi:hypothetical protein